MNVTVACWWLRVMLSWMNGSGGFAFSGSLLWNESPSFIVKERRVREDLYLLSFLLLVVSLCGAPALAFFSPTSASLAARLSFHASLSEQQAPTSPPPKSCLSGGWERERTEEGREVGKERGGTDGWIEGGGGILQVATVSQSIAHWATSLLHPFSALHLIHRGERRRRVCCVSNALPPLVTVAMPAKLSLQRRHALDLN